jgi:hypothetical protein
MAKGSDAPKLLLMLLRLSNRQTRAIIVTANVYFESEHDRIEGGLAAAIREEPQRISSSAMQQALNSSSTAIGRGTFIQGGGCFR